MGDAIRDFRESAHLTQEQLAERADLNPKYLSEVERGRANISLDALVRVAKSLGVSVQDVVAGL